MHGLVRLGLRRVLGGPGRRERETRWWRTERFHSHSLSSDLIPAPLRRVKKICQDEGAVLLFVDFWETSRWRAHGAMANWLRQANIEMQSIAPREILMDYKF